MMFRGSLSVLLCVLCVVLLLVPFSCCDDSFSDSEWSVSSSSSWPSDEWSDPSAPSRVDETRPTEPPAANEQDKETGKQGPTSDSNSNSNSNSDTDSSDNDKHKDTYKNKDQDQDQATDSESPSQSTSKLDDSSSRDMSPSTPSPAVDSVPSSLSASQSEFKPTNESITINTTTSTPTPTRQVEGAIFAGFQGQAFDFRAMADEVYNLVSSPHLQLNAHMTYIAAGDCTSNETPCFTHPGAYMDELGFLVGPYKIQVSAGSRNARLSLHVQGASIKAGQFPAGLRVPTTTRAPASTNPNDTEDHVLIIRYDTHTQVTITTSTLQFVVINSDGFLNIAVSLLDAGLLQLGSRRFNLSDPDYCHNNVTTSSDDPTQQQQSRVWIEKHMEQVYGKNQMHGLIGQTWRAATICDRDWIGNVQDYICSGLFASDYVYCLYQPQKHS